MTDDESEPPMKVLVGEIGSEDDPVTVYTEPVPDDEDFNAYGLAMFLKNRGWRNVRGEEPVHRGEVNHLLDRISENTDRLERQIREMEANR